MRRAAGAGAATGGSAGRAAAGGAGAVGAGRPAAGWARGEAAAGAGGSLRGRGQPEEPGSPSAGGGAAGGGVPARAAGGRRGGAERRAARPVAPRAGLRFAWLCGSGVLPAGALSELRAVPAPARLWERGVTPRGRSPAGSGGDAGRVKVTSAWRGPRDRDGEMLCRRVATLKWAVGLDAS